MLVDLKGTLLSGCEGLSYLRAQKENHRLEFTLREAETDGSEYNGDLLAMEE
ncbi:unnamed protein product, partial [marine sediment metagenome]